VTVKIPTCCGPPTSRPATERSINQPVLMIIWW